MLYAYGHSANAIDFSDLKDEISSINSTISSLNSQIREAETSVTRLDREKNELQTRISSLRSTIQAQRSTSQTYQSQMNNAARVQTEISGLQDHATSTVSNVRDVANELQKLKQHLDSCAAVLSQENTEMKVKTAFMDKFMLKKSRNARQFEREKKAILQVTEALGSVHSKVPAMLPGSSLKFLELKPSTKGNSKSKTTSPSIPSAVLRHA